MCIVSCWFGRFSSVRWVIRHTIVWLGFTNTICDTIRFFIYRNEYSNSRWYHRIQHIRVHILVIVGMYSLCSQSWGIFQRCLWPWILGKTDEHIEINYRKFNALFSDVYQIIVNLYVLELSPTLVGMNHYDLSSFTVNGYSIRFFADRPLSCIPIRMATIS